MQHVMDIHCFAERFVVCDPVCPLSVGSMKCISWFACIQLVELSSTNSAETAAVQLQDSTAAVTQFVQGQRVFIVT